MLTSLRRYVLNQKVSTKRCFAYIAYIEIFDFKVSPSVYKIKDFKEGSRSCIARRNVAAHLPSDAKQTEGDACEAMQERLPSVHRRIYLF